MILLDFMLKLLKGKFNAIFHKSLKIDILSYTLYYA